MGFQSAHEDVPEDDENRVDITAFVHFFFQRESGAGIFRIRIRATRGRDLGSKQSRIRYRDS